MDKGIYCLVFENPACTVRIGALGPVRFPAGWHIYIGSALGSGGLARLSRHIALSRAKDRTPKWHVDYLSTAAASRSGITVHAVTGERFECRLAEALGRPGHLRLWVQRLYLPVAPPLPGEDPARGDPLRVPGPRPCPGHQNHHEPVMQ